MVNRVFIVMIIFLSVEVAQAKLKADVSIVKEKIQKNDVIQKANKLLKVKPFSVIHKTGIASSGNKHDYYSLAPYFWPNPKSVNGLPYIRKDGEINPETRTNFNDYEEWRNFTNAISTLNEAYKISKDKKYSEKINELVFVWFINPETLMNPNLDYAQGVKGVSSGRQFGIIEFSAITNVLETVSHLDKYNLLNSKVKTGFNSWLSLYANWLQHSDFGKKEGNTTNNHATTYDLQLANIFIYLNETEKLKKLLEEVKTKRIATQIDADGKQPEELARTKSFSYSLLNLSALTELAVIGEKHGVDLWTYKTNDGRSIKKAYEFLIPFLDKNWPYEQIASYADSRDRLIKMLITVGTQFNESSYLEIAEKYK